MITTCGIFLICKTDILICHATGANPKSWSVPKGLMDENETPYQTALREFKEETGVDIGLYCLGIYDIGTRVYKNKKKQIKGFIAICDTKPTEFKCESFTPQGKPEIDLIEWVPVAVGIKLIHEAQRELFLDFIKKTEGIEQLV